MKVFRLFMMRRRRPLHSRPPVFPTMPLRRKKQIQKMTRRAMLARQTVRLPVVPRVEARTVRLPVVPTMAVRTVRLPVAPAVEAGRQLPPQSAGLRPKQEMQLPCGGRWPAWACLYWCCGPSGRENETHTLTCDRTQSQETASAFCYTVITEEAWKHELDSGNTACHRLRGGAHHRRN